MAYLIGFETGTKAEDGIGRGLGHGGVCDGTRASIPVDLLTHKTGEVVSRRTGEFIGRLSPL